MKCTSTIHGHITSGSRNLGSQYISTTRNLEKALARAQADGGLRVVRIDLDMIHNNGSYGPSRVIDVSNPEAAAEYLNPKATSTSFALDSEEVLIVGDIDYRAVQVVSQ